MSFFLTLFDGLKSQVGTNWGDHVPSLPGNSSVNNSNIIVVVSITTRYSGTSYNGGVRLKWKKIVMEPRSGCKAIGLFNNPELKMSHEKVTKFNKTHFHYRRQHSHALLQETVFLCF